MFRLALALGALAFGCSSSSSPYDISGTYDTTFETDTGAVRTTAMTLALSGASVHGTYLPSVAPAEGSIRATFAADVVTGEWAHGNASGPIRLVFSVDRASFTGTWDYAGGSGRYAWNGTRR